MALSTTQKLRRAQVLATAIAILRDRMKLSQEDLAAAIGGVTDVGSISRWERGEFSPSPSKRKRLAAIARKHGWGDLIAAFEQPIYEWKSALLSERERHLCSLFEIVVLNQPARFGLNVLVSRRDYARLIRALRTAVRSIKSAAASAGRPIAKFGDGQVIRRRGVCIATDEQVEAWQYETRSRRAKVTLRPKSKSDRPGLVIWYNDGHVEMYRDDKEYDKAMRERSRTDKES